MRISSNTFLFFLILILPPRLFFFFFFNDTATTEIYTLSLHDALPIFSMDSCVDSFSTGACPTSGSAMSAFESRTDRKSTRLNSSHDQISYAVFCLKKKKKKECRFVLLIVTGVITQ